MSRNPDEPKYKREKWSGDWKEDMSPSNRGAKTSTINWPCENKNCDKYGTGSHPWWQEHDDEGRWLCIECQEKEYGWRHHSPELMERQALMEEQARMKQQALRVQAERSQVERENVVGRAEAAAQQAAETFAQLPGFCPETRRFRNPAKGQGQGGPGGIRRCERCKLEWEAPLPFLGVCMQCGGNVTDANKPEASNMEVDG